MDCDAITGLALEPPLTSLHTVDMDRIKYLSTCIRDISNLETTLAEGLRQLSLCTYNLAAVFIKRSDNGSNAHFQLAFNLASISASSLESYIDHHRQENSGNKNSALENVAALCKRLNLCWSAAVSMTNYSDACDYLVKHINFATITEADKALLIAPQSASSPPTSPSSTAAMYKLIDTYIKCQLKLLTSHHDGNGNYSTLTSLLKREDGWKDVVILGELELLGLSEYSSSAFSSRIDAARLEICQKLETVYRNNQCPIRLSR